MNHPKDTAPIAAFRNVETTEKTLAADSAISAERALNAAIVNADITRGFEEYLAVVDQYYAEDVEVSTDVSPDPLVGKQRLKSVFSASSFPFTSWPRWAGCGCRSRKPLYEATPLTSSIRSGPSN